MARLLAVGYRRPEEHPQLSAAELAYIESDPPDPPAAKVPWIQLIPRPDLRLRDRQVPDRPDLVVLPLLDPVVFREKHKLDLLAVGLPLIVIYLIADVGSVGGGWLASRPR